MTGRIKEVPCEHPQMRSYRLRTLRILESYDKGCHHLSVSHPSRVPTWQEMEKIYKELGKDNPQMAMILPPKEQYVNVHDNCLHLFAIEDNISRPDYSDSKVEEHDSYKIEYGRKLGKWFMRITADELPSWEIIRDARYKYVPNKVNMAIIYHWCDSDSYRFELTEIAPDRPYGA